MTRPHRAGATRTWQAAVPAALAGAAALNIVTYLDMALRARPASTTPEQTAARLSDLAHVSLGPPEQAANRRTAVGALLGYAASVAAALSVTAAAGRRRPPTPVATALFTAAAMVTASAPMTLLRVTDPRRWSATDWATDIVPHLAYGLTTAAIWRRLAGD
jgi:hypothetical protein